MCIRDRHQPMQKGVVQPPVAQVAEEVGHRGRRAAVELDVDGPKARGQTHQRCALRLGPGDRTVKAGEAKDKGEKAGVNAAGDTGRRLHGGDFAVPPPAPQANT